MKLLGAVALFLASCETSSAFVLPSAGLVGRQNRPSVESAFPREDLSLSLFGRFRRRGLRAKERGEGYGPPLENIGEAVGNTPMVKINERLCPEGRTIYAKCEYFNPLSSVKDRLALSIIETAEKEGKLKPGDTVIEATSGNTGIAVAMMCAQRGYKCVITMAEPFSVERRKLMRMLGASVIVTPKAGKGTGMVEKAAELAEKHGWFLCHQFETDANWKFHEETTGPEICNDLKGVNGGKFDYWVTGYGTGGTFHGAGKYIKATSPDTKIVLAEPGAANLLDSGIPTERNADGSPNGSHPAFKAHPIQGWTPDFIPLVLEKGMDLKLMDEYVPIPDGVAVQTSQDLARTQGILTGISGGATMWAAIETAKKAPEGSVVVCMLPDTGERYLSTPLFASIAADMNEEELEIAKSTPSHVLLPS
uniref:Tryptophan synthase beta chain-like PALP domain-containing protein n=1 Tax=Corethron hystrix TaxID=216773 RepID=A0A7S1BGX0_9STRA|mmetsp:Transcript_24950/g.57638  ORF Transcript_24950/g.57638 Transcript_24950/m.57638 type:complete len:421 (+) Transcript_24950:71-1333(+)